MAPDPQEREGVLPGDLGVKRQPGAIALGKGIVLMLRWVLGSSPSWALALRRVDAELPEGHRFRED